jgi:hypothetical protein
MEQKSAGPVELCGPYGYTNGLQYFLFDNNSPTQFAFLRIGQDTPPYDEKSIVFLKK